MFEKKSFGNRLRCLRMLKKINQTQIADVLGVTKTQISDIENGKTTTSIEKLVVLADYFGVSLDSLVGRSEDLIRKNHSISVDAALDSWCPFINANCHADKCMAWVCPHLKNPLSGYCSLCVKNQPVDVTDVTKPIGEEDSDANQ